MTPEQRTQIEAEIAELQSSLTGDMFTDMETRDKIHNLQMTLAGRRPMNTEIECVGCGS